MTSELDARRKIARSLYDALGVRLYEVALNAEKVWKAIERYKDEALSEERGY
jgi:hypothetical protein